MGSPKAENAAAKARVFVKTEVPRPIKATAPKGSGCVMIPTMVAKKMESNCHAILETPEGGGRNQIITPVAMEAMNGLMAAPCHGWGAGTTGTAEVEADGFETIRSRLIRNLGFFIANWT